MWSENCRRIIKGYDPYEPTTIGDQLFYVIWCLLYGLKIFGMRIRRRISWNQE